MEEKIISIVEAVLNVPTGTVTKDTRADEIEAWDSLAQVMIVGEIESQLGVSISLDIAADFRGVKDFISFLEK